MGMPITVEIVTNDSLAKSSIDEVFSYFREVDNRFSTYKPKSEISQINLGLSSNQWSSEMIEVMALCNQTKDLTSGYFDINFKGKIDPSGLVKGWSIYKASQLINQKYHNYYIEAGGDIELAGLNKSKKPWQIGIRNPLNIKEVVKVVSIDKGGIATSGNYVRGQHIYNPINQKLIDNPISLTVIGPNIFEADRFATAAFAMGLSGINLIEKTKGLEGFMIDKDMIGTKTTNFERYER